MKDLTPKQLEVLEYIQDYVSKYQTSPSLGEIGQRLDIKHKRGVAQYLESLERKGYINRNGEARGLKLLQQTISDFIYIPILGMANAGQPLVYSDSELRGKLQVDKTLIPRSRELFAVIIKGDSMNQRQIEGHLLADGAYAVVDPESEVHNGDAVLAIIDECATIKNFTANEDKVILYPQSNNPIHQPIYVSSERQNLINGKVVAVLERP